jgi:hypothetical protein
LIENEDQNLTLNCGYGKGLSVLEVLDAVDRVNGQPIHREMKERRAGECPIVVEERGDAAAFSPAHDRAIAWFLALPRLEAAVRLVDDVGAAAAADDPAVAVARLQRL